VDSPLLRLAIKLERLFLTPPRSSRIYAGRDDVEVKERSDKSDWGQVDIGMSS
jgi:hypothetical protein